MKADLPLIIRKAASFCNKQLSNSQVKTLAEHLSSERPALNKEKTVKLMNDEKVFGDHYRYEGKFIRNGNVGQLIKVR